MGGGNGEGGCAGGRGWWLMEGGEVEVGEG